MLVLMCGLAFGGARRLCLMLYVPLRLSRYPIKQVLRRHRLATTTPSGDYSLHPRVLGNDADNNVNRSTTAGGFTFIVISIVGRYAAAAVPLPSEARIIIV
jgi:hypothetical protein